MMKHTRRDFTKLGVTTLPVAGLLNGSYSAAFASTSSSLQNESPKAAAPEAPNDLKTPAGAPFMPDYVFSGSALNGWHVFGQADWRAENGDIFGKAHLGSNGGWLVLDKSYQDVIFFARFRTPAGSKAGVLVRAEKTAGGGFKGIYFSLDPEDLNSYHLILSSEGQEISRRPLRAVPPDSNRVALPAIPGSQVAAPPPNTQTSLATDGWSTIAVQMDANVFRPQLNGGYGIQAGATDDDGSATGYGPIALYAGGTGEIQFKDVCYKDFGRYVTPIEKVSSNYRMQRIDDFYFTWGASVADVNRDGILDIVTGPYYYLGPDYTVKREVALAQTFAPGREFDQTMVIYTSDFTRDGWPDLLVATLDIPLTLYKNPRGELRRWDKYIVGPRVSSEVAILADINNDGTREIVFTTPAGRRGINTIVYAAPDPKNPTGEWIIHPISQPGPWGPHGMGIGDITGDGTPDVLMANGWWEHPAKGSVQELWTYHAQAFNPDPPSQRTFRSGGATMAVYDVNGDGLNDVVTSLHAHGFGLAWYEQKRDNQGNISFVTHMIMDDFATQNAGGVTFTELHGATCADMDGDGIPDFITGKRFISEDDVVDPDPWGAPVLYVYHTVRDKSAPGGARFAPELIHNRSGVGSMVTVADLNGNGAMDIITSTNRGTFVFWGK
jgi:Domain of Unknown Function (DUF1080)/FG-GAP-like repeat